MARQNEEQPPPKEKRSLRVSSRRSQERGGNSEIARGTAEGLRDTFLRRQRRQSYRHDFSRARFDKATCGFYGDLARTAGSYRERKCYRQRVRCISAR